MKSLTNMVTRIVSVTLKRVVITLNGEPAERDQKASVIVEQFRKYSPTQVKLDQRTEIVLHNVFVTNALKIAKFSNSECKIIVHGHGE